MLQWGQKVSDFLRSLKFVSGPGVRVNHKPGSVDISADFPAASRAARYEPPWTLTTRFHEGVWQVSIVDGVLIAPTAYNSFNDAGLATMGWTNLAAEVSNVQVRGTWSHMVGPGVDVTGDGDTIYSITHHLSGITIEVVTSFGSGYQDYDDDNRQEEIWPIGSVTVAAGAVNDPEAAVSTSQQFVGTLAISTIVTYKAGGGGAPDPISAYINGSLLP
jgi:hypothetical protein